MSMQKTLWLFMFSVIIMVIAPSCNSNKIACPAYADSAPEKKSDGEVTTHVITELLAKVELV